MLGNSVPCRTILQRAPAGLNRLYGAARTTAVQVPADAVGTGQHEMDTGYIPQGGLYRMEPMDTHRGFAGRGPKGPLKGMKPSAYRHVPTHLLCTPIFPQSSPTSSQQFLCLMPEM